MEQQTPYVSIVMAVRNDDYGGDFNMRLQLSVWRLAHLTNMHKVPMELVLVNYNPVADRPGLEETITWPAERFLSVRLITVPESLHRRFVQPEVRKTVPLFEFIAKNVGIRRAHGQFVLCTNADILLSQGLIAFLARGELKPAVIYRSDRYDFKLKAGEQVAVASEAFEELLQQRVFAFYMQGGSYALTWPRSFEVRLKLLRKYNAFRRWYYDLVHSIPGHRYFLVVPYLKETQVFLLHYHCNASGDMTLMDRDSWVGVRGYLEDTWISTHTDSLLVMSATAAGMPIDVLPHPVYHQHHNRRFDFGVRDPAMDRMYRRLLEQANHMLQSKTPIMNPTADWGLGEETLEEQRPAWAIRPAMQV
jgi:hypothetical protein